MLARESPNAKKHEKKYLQLIYILPCLRQVAAFTPKLFFIACLRQVVVFAPKVIKCAAYGIAQGREGLIMGGGMDIRGEYRFSSLMK